MKKTISVILFSLFLLKSHAQFQAGLNLGLDIPVGDFAGWSNSGFCFGAAGKYALNEKMSVGANLLYNSFGGDRYQDPYYNYKNYAYITAFTGLFQYYFSEAKFRPYAGGDLGFYFYKSRFYTYDGYWINPGGNWVPKYGYYYWRGTALGIAPAAGITYDITDKLIFDGNAKFNLMLTESGLNYAAINLGLFYKFGE